MSKIDQAFVKAFARRQTADVNQSDAEIEIPSGATTGGGEPTMTSATNRPSIRVDRSVADTTAVWVDPHQETMMRGDQAHRATPGRPFGLQQSAGASAETNRLNSATYDLPPQPPNEAGNADSTENAQPVVVPQAYAIASFTADVGLNALDVAQSLVDHLTHVQDPTPSAEMKSSQDGMNSVECAAGEPADETSESPISTATAIEERQPEPSAAPESFRPAWEVDAFDIPDVIANLFFDEATFESIGRHIAGAVRDGMQTAVLTSVNRGEGRSTTALGVALAAAASGIRVLLIDADVVQPTLADSLRLDAVTDWMDQILAKEPVEEAAIVSTHDLLTFLPLTASDAPELAAAPLRELLAIVRPHFDLIVMDAGCGDEALEGIPSGIDAAMLVHDASVTSAADINGFARSLSRHGFRTVGVIKNFAGKSDSVKVDANQEGISDV